MIETKERRYYETLHSQDDLSVTYLNNNNVVVRQHVFFISNTLEIFQVLKNHSNKLVSA